MIEQSDSRWDIGAVVSRTGWSWGMEAGVECAGVTMIDSSNPISLTPSQEPPGLFDRLQGALLEDLAMAGDITSQSLVPERKIAQAIVVSKANGVLCGVKLLPLIFQMAEQLVCNQALGHAWDLEDAQEAARIGKTHWDAAMQLGTKLEKDLIIVTPSKKDGEKIQKTDSIARIEGNARAILAGERVALNLLSHLSGIATQTSLYVTRIAHTKAKILDTRKTMPLWRDLEKYAVKCGGGENHRRGLYDMILIKDNHLALWGSQDPAGAVNAVRAKHEKIPIEVEVVDLAGLRHVCQNASPDFILLDNFHLEDLQEAVRWCKTFYAEERKNILLPLLEASGGVNLENVQAIAETGVDRISVGALTHSSGSLDISLEIIF